MLVIIIVGSLSFIDAVIYPLSWPCFSHNVMPLSMKMPFRLQMCFIFGGVAVWVPDILYIYYLTMTPSTTSINNNSYNMFFCVIDTRCCFLHLWRLFYIWKKLIDLVDKYSKKSIENLKKVPFVLQFPSHMVRITAKMTAKKKM